MTRQIPILFSAPMVRALLDGRKTQTRRTDLAKWEKVKPGDLLWVREVFSGPHRVSSASPRNWDDGCPIWYWADGNPDDGDWTRPKPSIHMPKWASRLTLEVTAVRTERLQKISEEDARAEGADDTGFCDHARQRCEDIGCFGPKYRGGFRFIWESIHNAASSHRWHANPHVAVVTFKVHRRNVMEIAND